MQLDAAVVRAGQAAAAQTAGFHPKIPPVLLHHHVGRYLGGAKEGMLAGVDGEGLRDSLPVGGIVIVPTGLQLFEFNEVGPVAVHLVGRHVSEGALRAGPPGGFQEIESADGVDVEIVERAGGGQIVTGLGGGVDDGGGLQLGNERENLFTIPDVELVMLEAFALLFQSLLVPPRVAAGSEEVGSLVVVDPVHLRALFGEVADDLGTDQA